MKNNNLDIECVLLSTFIFENDTIDEFDIKSQDFYMPFHQDIYLVMQQLRADNHPIDEIFIKQALDKKRKFDEVQFLNILSVNATTNIESYVKKLKDLSVKRDLIRLSKEVQALIIEKEPTSTEAITFLTDKIERIESGAGSKVKARSWLQLMEENSVPPIFYATRIPFLDRALGGGFTMGQLVTITGEQEAGKTQLLSQILLSSNFQSLYFGLEFNGRQTGEYGKHKITSGANVKEDFASVDIITSDETTGEIDEVIAIIKSYVKKKAVKFVAIDSAMMLGVDDASGKYATAEEKISSIFLKLMKTAEKLDIVILLIAQSSKSDIASKKIEIFGSKKAAHFAKIMLHINFDREAAIEGEKYTRDLIIGKNKQTGKLANLSLGFDSKKLEFYAKGEQDSEFIGAEVSRYEMPDIDKNDIVGYNEALDITIEEEEEISEKTKSDIDKLAKAGVNFE